MPFVVHKKATLLIPTGTEGHHLFVVTTGKCDEGMCLLTSFSSIKANGSYDKTCILEAGEHPFLTKPSFVEYRLSKTLMCDKIERLVAGWGFQEREDISDAVLDRIRLGFDLSNLTPKYIADYFSKNQDK